MGKPAVLRVRITGDATSAVNATRRVSGSVDGMVSKLKGVAGAALGAFAVGSVAGFVSDVRTAASDVQQAMGAVDSVFKDSAGQIKAWAAQSAESVGLSKSEYAGLSSTLGAQLKNMGTPMSELAGQTNSLVTLGSDLAAQFGGSTSDAVAALSSLLRGERDPIERYGVSISEAAVQAKIAALGLDTSTDAAAKSAKAQATLALLSEQTADAQGAFAREADTAAGAQARANARWEDAKAVLGERLLPAFTAIANFASQTLIPAILAIAAGVASMAAWIGRNIDIIAAFAVVMAAFAIAVNGQTIVIAAYLAVCKAVSIATRAWAVVQGILNVVMTANPIGLIIVAIIALVAAIVIAYRRSETFRRIVQAVFRTVAAAVRAAVNGVVAAFNWCRERASAIWAAVSGLVSGAVTRMRESFQNLKDRTSAIWSAIRSAIQRPIDAIRGFINGLIDRIRSLIDWFGNVKVPDWLSSVGDWAGNLFSAAPAPAARAGLLGATAARATVRVSSRDLAALASPNVVVYIGDTELRAMIRTEYDAGNARLARKVGARAGVPS